MSLSKPASDLRSGLIRRRAPAWALVFCGLLGTLAEPAAAQSADASALGDPTRCLVVVEDAGNVGLRIADAQSVHEAVLTNLRKRLGNDAVIYEGSRKNAEKMKKMLGKSSETQIQDSQLAYYDAAMKAAPWRVKARFGAKKGQHFITLSCRKADAKATLDEQRFTGKSFSVAKDAMAEKLDSFCQLLPTTATLIPVEKKPDGAPGVIPGMSKHELKPWTPPPKRD
jgi:hypothetical protein